MKAQSSSGTRQSLYSALLICMVILGVILACGSPTMLATVNLSADQINQVAQGAVNEDGQGGWRFEVGRVELQEGFLRVYGDYFPGTSEALAGSFDMTLSVEAGALSAQVPAVDIQGVQWTDPWLQQVSARFAQSLAGTAAQGRQGVEIVSVKIGQQALQIGLRFLP